MAFAAVLSAVGSLVSGFASFAAGNYQAKIADMNAKIADENAVRAIGRSQIEQESQDNITRGMIGEQTAAQSASGISLNSKSSVLTRKAARELGRVDALNIRQAGEIEAYNYKVDAVNQRAQGQLAKASGVSSLLGGFLGAGSSLVGSSRSTQKSYDPWTTRKGKSMRFVG